MERQSRSGPCLPARSPFAPGDIHVDHLRQNGDYENTLIMFTSDHGEMLGDHYLFGKFSYFDTAFHTPLIIRAPGAALARRALVG
jgi:arylsulfatase A-like enzyme